MMGCSYLQLFNAVLEQWGVWAKPSMPHDSPHVTTLGRIRNEHHPHQVSSVRRHMVGEHQGCNENVVVELVDVVSVGIGRVIIKG